MNSLALYRLPHQHVVTCVQQTDGQPAVLSAFSELNGRSGFVVAPFAVTDDSPLLVIDAQKTVTFPQDDAASYDRIASAWSMDDGLPGTTPSSDDDGRSDYASHFQKFHSRLTDGTFRKIVLARSAECHCEKHPLTLFEEACINYPRMFVALVYTPQSGCWLMATPEILLEKEDGQWRTIALAGTMALKDSELDGEGTHLRWSTKNIQEQRYVASYVMTCLKHHAQCVTEDGPRSVRAANLVHLRSDFTFVPDGSTGVGDLVEALHPTPAVCGLPKAETFSFIQAHEQRPRQYYSGFMGPLDVHGSTHLYVSLRCMQMARGRCRLYAGGGLLRESVEQQEWLETEAKMQVMRRLINGVKE